LFRGPSWLSPTTPAGTSIWASIFPRSHLAVTCTPPHRLALRLRAAAVPCPCPCAAALCPPSPPVTLPRACARSGRGRAPPCSAAVGLDYECAALLLCFFPTPVAVQTLFWFVLVSTDGNKAADQFLPTQEASKSTSSKSCSLHCSSVPKSKHEMQFSDSCSPSKHLSPFFQF
jgi:hypothetical protein